MSKELSETNPYLKDAMTRERVLTRSIHAAQMQAGHSTTEAEAEAAEVYHVVTESERATFFDLDRFKGLKRGETDTRHEMFVRAIGHEPLPARHDVNRDEFATINGSPLAYERIKILSFLFKCHGPLDPVWAGTAQGLATAADERLVRWWWEVVGGECTQSGYWKRFAKGGDYSRFYSDVALIVCWSTQAVTAMKTNGRVQGVNYYFKPGLTWPLRTQRGFNLRVMPQGRIFGHKGPAIFPKESTDTYYILAIANSAPAEFILRGLMSFGSWEVGVIKRLPIPSASPDQHERLSTIARSIHDAKRAWDSHNEIATHFTVPWLLSPPLGAPGVLAVNPSSSSSSSSSLPSRLDSLSAHESAEESRIQRLYADLNDQAYHLYGIADASRQTIEASLGERPPEILWPQMEGKSVEQKRMEHVWRLLSFAVKRVIEADVDGIVPFTPASGETSLVDRVRQELASLLPERDESQLETEIVNELKRTVKGYRKCQSIEDWLANAYFEYHAGLYKDRPIYWHIASSQGTAPFAFGALVHYHRFDKNRMDKLKAGYIRDVIEDLRREAGLADKAGRVDDRTDLQAKVEQVQTLAHRLQLVQEGHHEGPDGGNRDYRIGTPWKTAEQRPKGWNPDLDDGVKVNIEPLEKAGVLRLAKVT